MIDDKVQIKSRNVNKTTLNSTEKSTQEQAHQFSQSANNSPLKLQDKDNNSKKEKQSATFNNETSNLKTNKFHRIDLKSIGTSGQRTSKSIEKTGPVKNQKIEAFNNEIPKNASQNSTQDIIQPAAEVKSEKIKVAVRVRPFLKTEIAKENVCIVGKNGKSIRVSDVTHTVEGQYDRVFSKDATQNDVYSFVADCIPNLISGFNCTIFAYGQTGSGKTYTMFGEGVQPQKRQIQQTSPQGSVLSGKISIDDYMKHRNSAVGRDTTNSMTTDATSLLSQNVQSAQKKGIIPRCIQELFTTVKNSALKVTVYCSFLQIYNEKLYDLLQDSYTKNPLQIREEKFAGIYVEGISEYIVQNEQDCMLLLLRGEKNRIKRSTKMNMKSSRSHSIFQILLETDQVDSKGMLKRSKLNLGDLAGSEKVNKDEEMQAKHMLELRNINLSLTTLGKVIQQLSQPQQNTNNQQQHIPFRESKLTRLLQDSIGGNTSTYLITTVSPLVDSIEETISTLKFADRAKCVMQRIRKNEINAKDDALVQKLHREVQYLKELLALKRKGKTNDMTMQLYLLKDENERLRQIAMNYDEIERMKQENKMMRLELQKLRTVASEVNSSYNGDSSPKSFQGVKLNSNLGSVSKPEGLANIDAIASGNDADGDSDSDSDIQKQFQTYQSQTDLVKITDSKNKKLNASSQYGIGISSVNQNSELNSNRGGNLSHRGVMNSSANMLEEKIQQHSQINSLKQQKERLQQVIQEQQQIRQFETSLQTQGLRKRAISGAYKGSESSDEAQVDRNNHVQLPIINESNANLPQKLQFSRKNSNQELLKAGSPYSLNRTNHRMNPVLKSHDNMGAMLSDLKSIKKYPNQRNIQNVRMSLGSINDISPLYPKQPTINDVNRSYQINSSGYNGMITQSSLYGGAGGDSPAQTVVRIRGKNNQMIETKGNIMMSLEEEKRINERKRQIRRSNERLKMLETMEQDRQLKMEQELDRINQEKVKREQEQQRKREALKQRKYWKKSAYPPLSNTGRPQKPKCTDSLFVYPIQIREGLFSEDQIKQLEDGYSVSETDDDHDGLSSQHSSNHLNSAASPMIGAGAFKSSALNHRVYSYNHDEGTNHDEARFRLDQQRSLMHAEIGNIKSKYLKKMTGLERMLDSLKNEKRELQLQIENQKQVYQLKLVQQDQKAQEQLREIRDQQFKLQGQVPNFKEKLDSYKKEIGQQNLIVSEETYVELKAKTEDQRSLKEYIQVKAYEALEKFQREIENLRRENDQLAEDNMNLKIKQDRDFRELDSMKRLSKEREEDARRRIDAAERKVKELESDLHRINSQYKVLLEKGLTQKEVDQQFRELEINFKTLQNKHRLLEEQFSKVNEQKIEIERRSDSYRREIDILNQDKTFLTRENTSLDERVKRLEDKLDRTEVELSDAKKTAQKYMDRVLQTNDDVKNKFEQQYSQEINDLKERHARELDLAKQNLIEIYEKRVEHQRERKEELERRLNKLEQDYRDKNKSFEELLVEFRSLQKTGDEEIGRLKLQVISKSDELQRVMHLYEDNMVLVKDLKLENEGLKQKIDILKSEYYKLESLNRQGSADIKAELAVCKERLGNYELIEKELDSAIMNVANNEYIEGEIDNVGNALIQTITSAPTTSKRRIQQSLLLANRLQIKQKENEALQQEIKQFKEKLENYETEVKFHKRMVEKTNQPYSYMIQDVERSEKQLLEATKRIKLLEDTIQKLRKENDNLVLQKKGIQEDLNKLLVKRQEIESLQTTLSHIIQHSTAKKIDIDELKHKLAEGIRQSRFKNESLANKENGFKRSNKSKSKSPGHFMMSDEFPEKGSAVKQYNEVEGAPAWYKALSSKLKQ